MSVMHENPLGAATTRPLPRGTYFHPEKGIVVEGIVARQMGDHPLGARPGRDFDSVAFNDLGGNTVLTAFLAGIEPGGTKCGHRHLDETLSFVVKGQGWSEFRQEAHRPLTTLEWKEGDLISIPANCWHEHFNGPGEGRFLSFKNAPAVKRILGFGPGDHHEDIRFHNRYDDEPDYFTGSHPLSDGSLRLNFLRGAGTTSMPPVDPGLGEGVARQRYQMGGHRTLAVSVLAIDPGGGTVAHRPLAEEALLVLTGRGTTRLSSIDGRESSVDWSAGDLISPPLYVGRRHLNRGDDEVRLLSVRNTFIETGLGAEAGAFDQGLPDRFPDIADVGA